MEKNFVFYLSNFLFVYCYFAMNKYLIYRFNPKCFTQNVLLKMFQAQNVSASKCFELKMFQTQNVSQTKCFSFARLNL